MAHLHRESFHSEFFKQTSFSLFLQHDGKSKHYFIKQLNVRTYGGRSGGGKNSPEGGQYPGNL